MSLKMLPRTIAAAALMTAMSSVVGWAQDGASAGPIGAWKLKLEDGSRECTVTFRAEPAGTAHVLGVPSGCRHAFPALAGIATWAEPSDGQVQLADKAGRPLLMLASAGDGTLSGVGPDGGQYQLAPVGAHKALALKPPKTPADTASVATAAPAASAPVRALPTTAEVAGHYAVLRDKTRDTGCMVTLDPKGSGARGMLKANLAPACRDQGIVIFDPVAWELIGGRLVLMARKGHTAKFDLQEDSTWLKDPKDGKSMGLKRL